MPRYFFDICNGDERIPDEEGTVCADLEAALAEAQASARDLIRQFVVAEWPLEHRFIEMRDEAGNVIVHVPILAVLRTAH